MKHHRHESYKTLYGLDFSTTLASHCSMFEIGQLSLKDSYLVDRYDATYLTHCSGSMDDPTFASPGNWTFSLAMNHAHIPSCYSVGSLGLSLGLGANLSARVFGVLIGDLQLGSYWVLSVWGRCHRLLWSYSRYHFGFGVVVFFPGVVQWEI